MELFESISKLFNTDVNDMGYKELIKQRQEVKKNLAENLKEKLFMSENEIQAVLTIIEEYEAKIDKIKESIDFSEYSAKQAEEIKKKLTDTQNKMKAETEGIIKYIMREKLNKAQKMFGH